ncbi:MAG: rubredoxin, partial [ANME-2 cluster archaeon]|nr:rubredoxin [ANME-2 cluster archaeon]
MARYYCNICNTYEYFDDKGDSNLNISPGTKPKDFPDDYKCPICQADKTHMVLDIKEEVIKKEVTKDVTVSDVMVETMINWGLDTVFGMVGHSNLGLADA